MYRGDGGVMRAGYRAVVNLERGRYQASRRSFSAYDGKSEDAPYFSDRHDIQTLIEEGRISLV